MNPFDIFKTGKTYQGKPKENPQLAKTIEKMQEDFNKAASLPGATVIHDCVEIPAAVSLPTAKALTAEPTLAEAIKDSPFSRKHLIQYPFLKSTWEDIKRVLAKEKWHWSKFVYQGWEEITDDEGEVIRREKKGDIIGLLWYAHGNWYPVQSTDQLANLHYDIAHQYDGSSSDFWNGVEAGFITDVKYKDFPGYDVGDEIREYFKQQLATGSLQEHSTQSVR